LPRIFAHRLAPMPLASRARCAPLALCAALALCAPARADVGTRIIERCTAGESLAGFSQQAYSQALREMPAEVNEYSDCANLIRKAELAAAGGGSGGGSGGGPGSVAASVAPPSPVEQQKLAGAASARPASVPLGGEAVAPGVVHADIASVASTLPTPVLALLAFLAACGLLGGGRAIGKRLHGRTRRAG
jgi:hypothetical protein